MRNHIRIVIPLAALALVVGCNQSDNNPSTTSDTSGRASRDEPANVSRTSRNDTNATRNVRDRSDAALTPGDQGNNQSDLDLTRSIRRAINTNDQFSALAKNVKVITANGKVTLRGPVENQQEKQSVESAAKSAAPGATIDNQLDVKATNQ
jgi:osmotically-inducible protein OsmY